MKTSGRFIMKKLFTVVISVLLVWFVSGCSDSDNPTNPTNQIPSVKGIVQTDGQNGGLLHFIHKMGAPFAETEAYRRGGFLIHPDKSFPDDFIVSVNIPFQDLDCTYFAEIENFDTKKSLYIGPVSTLIYRYHLLFPDETLPECRAEVLAFLNIDPSISDFVIFIRKDLFSVDQFMEYASDFGEYEGFIQSLLNEIPGGVNPYDFTEDVDFPTNQYYQDLASDLAGNLGVPGAGCVAGWMVSLIGGGDGPPDPLKPIEDLLKEQAELLKQIVGLIQNLESELAKDIVELKNKIDMSTYDTAIEILNTPFGDISADYETLYTYSALDPSNSHQQEMTEFRASILANIPGHFNTIYLTLLGSDAGEEGVLSLYSRLAIIGAQDVADYASKISTQFSYFLGYLMNAIELTVEAYHQYTPPETQVASADFYRMMGKIEALLRAFDSYNPIGTLAKVTTLDEDIRDICVGKETIYANTANHIYALDLRTFEVVDSLQSNDPIWRMDVNEGRLYYVTCDTQNENGYLHSSPVGDISNEIGKIPVPCTNVADLHVNDIYVCVLESGTVDFSTQVISLHVFDPDLVEVSHFDIGKVGVTGIMSAFDLQDNHAYTISNSGTMYSLDIEHQKVLDTLQLPGDDNWQCWICGIAAKGDDAWVITGKDVTDGHVMQIDITDPSDMKQTGSTLDMSNPHALNFENNPASGNSLVYVFNGELDNPKTCNLIYLNPFSTTGLYPIASSEMIDINMDIFCMFQVPMTDEDTKYIFTATGNKISKWEKQIVFEIGEQGH